MQHLTFNHNFFRAFTTRGAVFACVVAIPLLLHSLSRHPAVAEARNFTRPRSTQATAGDPQVALEDILNFSNALDQEDQFLFKSYCKGLCDGTYVDLGSSLAKNISEHPTVLMVSMHASHFSSNPLLKSKKQEWACLRNMDYQEINIS
jgi:hypothetical protein